ncbi:tatD [Mytilus coruscus]|uniref:TatD n=1 Tax=Mytilus coruscus TaxID=42192 RepID=A0A6J8DNX4_MYTCO|nr:tatD [Mytilus coruscus]
MLSRSIKQQSKVKKVLQKKLLLVTHRLQNTGNDRNYKMEAFDCHFHLDLPQDLHTCDLWKNVQQHINQHNIVKQDGSEINTVARIKSCDRTKWHINTTIDLESYSISLLNKDSGTQEWKKESWIDWNSDLKTSKTEWETNKWELSSDYVNKLELTKQQEVFIPHGIMCFCDPDFYPAIIPDNLTWKVAIGIHPTKATFITKEKFSLLKRLFRNKHVCALGEIGLDRRQHRLTWMEQELVFQRMLGLSQTYKFKVWKPIIINVHGTENDLCSKKAYTDVLNIVKLWCKKKQNIHLCNFHGTADIVYHWLNTFPNTYFSFLNNIKDFTFDQLRAVEVVPLNRLLLQSYYAEEQSEQRVLSLADNADRLSHIREEELCVILEETFENGKNLFPL